MRPLSRFHRAAQLAAATLLGGLAFLAGHGSPTVLKPALDVAVGRDPLLPYSSAMAEAWSLAQAAQALATARQTDAALERMQRAYELSADATLLLEVGRLEQELGNFARATQAFEHLLQGPVSARLESVRASAARQLMLSSAGTARVNVQTNVQGAEIELEPRRGVASGAGFVVSLLLDAGERRVALSKPGYDTRSVSIVLEPGDVKTLRVDLDKAAGGRSETRPGKVRWALRVVPGASEGGRGFFQSEGATL